MEPRTCIIGPGRVGGSFAAALAARGVSTRLIGRADDPNLIAAAERVIVAVPDAAVAEVVSRANSLVGEDALIVHCCGPLGLEVFEGRRRAGCVHPATPIATSTEPLDGVWFGITATDDARTDCERLVSAVNGRFAHIPQESRAVHHAALVHASNHLVALAADASDLLGSASQMLQPLLERTVANIGRLGAADALTGPVSRGDAATVSAHLEALPPDIAESYRANALRALALAAGSKRLDPRAAERMRKVLEA
ncbi:MAG: DUF2520 domain-containing protein [Actinomycetota bacterium]